MKNYIAPGGTLQITAAAAISSGDGVLQGSIFGVANGDAASGAECVLSLVGVFELAKTASQAWTLGAKIYWDDTNKNCTTTVGSNKLIGCATDAAASGDEVGNVRLNGAAS